jgi:hypothetical protein
VWRLCHSLRKPALTPIRQDYLFEYVLLAVEADKDYWFTMSIIRHVTRCDATLITARVAEIEFVWTNFNDLYEAHEVSLH